MSDLLLSWIGPVVMLNDGNGFGLQKCLAELWTGWLRWVTGWCGALVVVRFVRRLGVMLAAWTRHPLLVAGLKMVGWGLVRVRVRGGMLVFGRRRMGVGL